MKVKNPWRNAACLLLLTGPFRYSRPAQRLSKPLAVGYSPYLEYKCSGTPQPEVLFVKRHPQVNFMASTHVFPGGVLDEADYSPSWFPLFTEPCSPDRAHPFSPLTSLKPRTLPLYSSCPDNSPIAGEVAFRICAIRELFEEAGVLLARDKGEVATLGGVVPGTCSPAIKELPQAETKEWRHKVHNNAYEFISLCREINCVPDIWSLVEWSNWLTPRNRKRRYDAVFYMCYADIKPEASPDLVEVSSTSWLLPSTAMDLFCTSQMKIAPPQFEQVHVLDRVSDVPLLHLYAVHKSVQENGVMQKRSTRIMTKDDVLISITERDDLSPIEGPEDWVTPVQHPQALKEDVRFSLSLEPWCELAVPTHTAEQLRDMSHVTDRMEFLSKSECRCLSSVTTEELESFMRQVL